MTFAEKGARRYTRLYGKASGFDYEDFASAAYLGLVIAAQKFDPSRGLKFTTMAFDWIDQHLMRLMMKDRRANGWMYQPTTTELAAGKKGMQRCLTLATVPEYLSNGEPNELGLEALLPPTEVDHVADIYRKEQRAMVLDATDNARERTIVEGLLDGQTLREIGARLNMSGARVQQLVEPLLGRVRARIKVMC